MSRILHTVRLTSPRHYGQKAPPEGVGDVLRILPAAVRSAIRMGFSGRSSAKGRQPTWLESSSDIRLVDYTGQRDTLLVFEAPTFGEAAPDLYEQRELWPTKPPAEDTGFDLLGDVLTDVNAGAEDSERFDRLLLRRLVRFQSGLAHGFDGLYVSGHRYPEDRPAALTAHTIDAASRLDQETPPTQRVRVAGRLDMIWQSQQRFSLVLDDGQPVPGVLIEGEPSTFAPLFNQRVVVHGRAVYRPSGQLLRLDAERIDAGPDEPALWSRIPGPRRQKMDVRTFRQPQTPQTPQTGLGAIIGCWPGDETDEEVRQALEELS